MTTTDISSGNATGLMAFLDFMIAKGYASAGSISPWKSAAKQVISTVEGDNFEQADVRAFDIDEYIARFENMSVGKYSAESLRAYRGRFRKAIESYRAYLADPNWRPQAPRLTRSSSKKAAKAQTSKPVEAVPARLPEASPPALVSYPFPLKSGQMAQLNLPNQLDLEDAVRMTNFIRALVFEQPAQLNPGSEED